MIQAASTEEEIEAKRQKDIYMASLLEEEEQRMHQIEEAVHKSE